MPAGEIGNSKAGLIPPIESDYEAILLRIHSNAELFKKGEQNVLDWDTKKRDVILEIAHDIDFLIGKNHPKYKDYAQHDISKLVCEMLQEHSFVDDNAFSWVRKTLSPFGFTNKDFANKTDSKNRNYLYIGKEELYAIFEKMPVDEQVKIYNQILAGDTERKRQIKLTKDNAKEWFDKQGIDPKTYSTKKNIFDPSYDESYSNDETPEPPTDLINNMLCKNKALDIANNYVRLSRVWFGIADNFGLFPPQSHELDATWASWLDVTNTKLVEKQLRFFSGFNDNKAVAVFPEWFNYLQHKAVHGNNAAASKYATPTGEFQEIERPDGSKYLAMLKRKVTNEHLKKKMPEQIKEIKDFWLFHAMFDGLDGWYNGQYWVQGGNEIDNAEAEQTYANN